jgi:hypothetical protein
VEDIDGEMKTDDKILVRKPKGKRCRWVKSG